ncbi:hypothetical protein [Botryobacter ruber]|uniref:hypothetical protein n=1 Tax=Botryobacter ruber TaxID=2171629 RepID=UPI000F64641C|nr:hypothetical protein [Botryobacter ruber]
MDELIIPPIRPVAIPKSNSQTPKLALIRDLLDVLHTAGIQYCHWKSNEHLDASMTGDTDLDILFDAEQREQLEGLLDKLGFKRLCSITQKQYKDIEDFIGMDLPSGKLVHVHAHFRLTMGEMYLKGYQLELEERILNSRVFDETFGIYTSDPAYELILLYFREALKLRNRDVMMMHLFNRVKYSENVLKEYRWLKQKTTEAQLKATLKTMFKNYKPIYQLVTGGFNRRELLKLSVIIKDIFYNNRLYSPVTANLLRWYREATVRVSRKLSRLLNRPILSQRINPRGGIAVAVIGADGSGKSTVTANLQSTFRQKLDVYKIYFGRGDGNMSWARRMLLRAKAVVAGAENKKKKKGTDLGVVRKRGVLGNLYKCAEAVIVAFEKRRNLQLMQEAREKGMFIICDRFPQNQIMGYNDGPLLHHLLASSNPLFREIAKWESEVYAAAENSPPDVLFKLIADAGVVEARKPGETSLETLEAKIAGVRSLKFDDRCKVVTVDATQPLDKVLYTIKEQIWGSYR